MEKGEGHLQAASFLALLLDRGTCDGSIPYNVAVLFYVLETGFPGLAWNSCSSCLRLPSAEIAGVVHHPGL
jgi:hypothetical protein